MTRPPAAPAWHHTLSLACALGLSACATPAPAPAPPPTPAVATAVTAASPALVNNTSATVNLQGQMSIKLGAWGGEAPKGISLGFFLQGNEEAGQLELMTALGSQMAKVTWQSGQTWLEDTQGRHDFGSLDALSVAALGEALPLKAMLHWMQGRPSPHLSCRLGQEDGLFEQAGWQVDTREFARHRLQAQRPATTDQRAVALKIYLDL